MKDTRALLEQAQWVDGGITAGYQSTQTKNNMQLPGESPEAKALGDVILSELAKNNMFMPVALPDKIFPPLFFVLPPSAA